MADHEFFGTLSVSEAATANDHVMRKGEVDTALAGKTSVRVDGTPVATFDVDTTPPTIAGVTGLQAALDAKAAATHGHGIADLPVATSGTSSATQLVRADDSRLSNARTPTSHTHATSEVTGLDTALAGKAAASHTHAIGDLPVAASGTSNTTQLVRADDSRLSNSRTPTTHSHAIADLPVATSGTSSTTQLVRADDSRLSNSRTPTAHSHAISDVTGLQTAIDGKAATSHTHTAAQITDLTAAVDARIGLVVDAAPTALDTLNELAAALGDDPNFAATMASQISGLDARLDTLEANAGVGIFKTTVGDGSLKLFTVTHNRNTTDVDVTVLRLSDGQKVYPVVKAPTANTVTVDFGANYAPPAASMRVIVDAK